ncbi:11748_t:CDS:1, partial [Scutellospora calospora]
MYEENPALYLTNIEEMPSGNDEDNEKFSEEKLGKFLNNEELSKTQKEKIKNLLKQEKDLFARNLNDLGQTN